MANRGPMTNRVAEEALDVRDEAQKLIDEIDAALADGEVSPEEALAVLRRARSVHREANEAYQLAEETNDATLAALCVLRGGAVDPTEYTEDVLRRGHLAVLTSPVPTSIGATNDTAA